MLKKPKILVVGSMVMDIIISTSIFPNSGETILGQSFRTAPGGKGLNQAVQAARMGSSVTMIGRKGNDSFGTELLAAATESGVDTSLVTTDIETSSAVGNIILEMAEGQHTKNRIIVVPGANMTIAAQHIACVETIIKDYDMVILQLEIPMEINEMVAKIGYDNGVKVMLNSAPSAPLSDEFLSHISIISPNEHEVYDLTGVKIRINEDGSAIEEDISKAVNVLLDKGIENVIITLGCNGAVVANKDFYCQKPCVFVKNAVDPTAAGDSFVGAFCTGYCAGLSMGDALDLANHTASITVSRMGAIPSLPTVDEVYSLMETKKFSGFDTNILKELY